MAKVVFDSGQTVEFDHTPTPDDIQEVANHLGIDKTPSPSPQPTSHPSDFSLGETIKNIPSSALNLAKNVGTAITHPATTVMGGIVRPIAGAIENIPGIPENLKNPQDLQAASAMKDFFIKRYGSIDAAKQTLQKDPAGFAADVSGVLSGAGGLAKLGDMGELGATLSKAGELTNPITPAISAVKTVGNLAGKLGAGYEGLATGLGMKNIQEIADAASQTPSPLLKNIASKVGVDLPIGKPELNDALSGKLGQQNIYDAAMNAVKSMKDAKMADYAPKLAAISKISEPLDMTPVLDEFQKKLKDYHIDQSPMGNLDFSHSIFARDAEGRNTVLGIQKMLEDFTKSDVPNAPSQLRAKVGNNPVDLETLKAAGINTDELNSPSQSQGGKFQTPEYIDILKRNLQGEYSPSSNARAFATALGQKTNDLLASKVPGYTEMTKPFEDATKVENQIRDALSLKNGGNESTAITKLQAALRQSFEYRQSMLDELNKHAGMDIKTAIAGNQANQPVPRGLAGAAIGALGGLSLATRLGSLVSKPLFWGALGTMSPKIVASTLSAIGYPAKVIGEALNNIATNKFAQQAAIQSGRMQRKK